MTSHDSSPDADWYVDNRCTNCDVARQLTPGLIGEVDGHSAVVRQPRDEAEIRMLHATAYACHTRSIRRTSAPLGSMLDPFPMRLDDRVFLCGHNSSRTAGADSYLLRRPTGNLMVDTPRWSVQPAARYEALGPVTTGTPSVTPARTSEPTWDLSIGRRPLGTGTLRGSPCS